MRCQVRREHLANRSRQRYGPIRRLGLDRTEHDLADLRCHELAIDRHRAPGDGGKRELRRIHRDPEIAGDEVRGTGRIGQQRDARITQRIRDG